MQVHAPPPPNLDALVSRNREAVRIRLAAAEDIDALHELLDTRWPVKGGLDAWRIITAEVGPNRHSFLVGTNESTPWMTSALTGLDLDAGLAMTQTGSIYCLLGEMAEGEPPQVELLCICATLNHWGLGPELGLPAIFF